MIKMAVRVAVAFFLLLPGISDASSQSRPTPPGGLKITARNPLPGNWICKGPVCECKPLACSAQSIVSYQATPTPARRPDPQALEKFAKVEVPKRVMAANAAQNILSDGKDKFEMVSTKVSKHHGFPSVLSETKLIKERGAVYIATAMIFAGPSLVSVRSFSQDRALAMKSLNEFIQAMTIEEGPPLNPNTAPNAAAPNAAPSMAPRPAPVAPRAPTRPALQEI